MLILPHYLCTLRKGKKGVLGHMNLHNYPLFKFQTIKVWSFELLGKISVNRETDIHANYIGTPGANFLNSSMYGRYLLIKLYSQPNYYFRVCRMFIPVIFHGSKFDDICDSLELHHSIDKSIQVLK